jgi:hypothetical protein
MKIMLLDIPNSKLVHLRDKVVKVSINKLLHNGLRDLVRVEQMVLVGLEDRNIPQLRVKDLRQETFKEYFGRVKGILRLVVIGKHTSGRLGIE